jgi:hypothetical protein
LARELIRLDFPAFERPKMATWGRPSWATVVVFLKQPIYLVPNLFQIQLPHHQAQFYFQYVSVCQA